MDRMSFHRKKKRAFIFFGHPTHTVEEQFRLMTFLGPRYSNPFSKVKKENKNVKNKKINPRKRKWENKNKVMVATMLLNLCQYIF